MQQFKAVKKKSICIFSSHSILCNRSNKEDPGRIWTCLCIGIIVITMCVYLCVNPLLTLAWTGRPPPTGLWSQCAPQWCPMIMFPARPEIMSLLGKFQVQPALPPSTIVPEHTGSRVKVYTWLPEWEWLESEGCFSSTNLIISQCILLSQHI